MKNSMKKLWPAYVAAGVLTVWQPTAQAEPAAVPTPVAGRFFIELKDANLADALEMVYKASGNAPHLIDESAKDVKVASAVFPNITAEDFIRQITTQNKFLIKKNAAGTTVIEPRTPPAKTGTGKTPGKVPGNPFDIALEVGQTPTILSEAQVARPTKTTTGTSTKSTGGREKVKLNPDGEYRLLVIRHVYAGGIARLFADSEVIPTEQMVLPESAGRGGGGGNNGGGGGFGGGGGISGGIGGQQNQNGGYGQQSGGIGGQQTGGIGGSAGGGIFSDRNLKENIVAIDSHQVLERVAELPIKSWNYKDQDAAIRHIGPMAQDFAGAFGVGEDDRRINAVDANGVTLASIQALYQITLQQSEQIKTLQQELVKLQAEKNAGGAVKTPAATVVAATVMPGQ